MKVRSPTVLLAKFQYRQAFGESRDGYFPPKANSAFSRKFLLTSDMLPWSSRINVPLLNHALGMM
jgi:hypothetical protein